MSGGDAASLATGGVIVVVLLGVPNCAVDKCTKVHRSRTRSTGSIARSMAIKNPGIKLPVRCCAYH